MLTPPQPLAPGDRIRIVAPSGAFNRERFAEGVALLQEAGLEPCFDDGLFESSRYFAGDDSRRLRELEAALVDPNARAIWTARGGYGAARLLPRLSVTQVAEAGKWLVGFSDATALHGAWAQAGLGSVHGANVTTLGSWSEEARAQLFAWLFGQRVAGFQGRVMQPGAQVHGPVLGGNLTVLASMAGTGALPSFDGALVLLEDVGERPYRLDRSLTQLLQAGVLADAVAFIIGQLTDCKGADEPDYSALDVVADTLAPLAKPVVGEFPFGHEPSSWAIPFGAKGVLDGDSGQLRIGWE